LASLPGLPATADAPPPPAPYSLPWLMRPTAAATVLRLDSTLALFEDPVSGRSGTTLVESLIGSYKLSKTVAPVARISLVRHDPPGAAAAATAFSNPLLGVTWAKGFSGGRRLALFGACTLPIGSGGGDQPTPAKAAAVAAGIPARSAMDNALFAVNYFTIIGGVGVTRVTKGLTLQTEITVLELLRARGPKTQDQKRTNLTLGLHAGHFFGARVSLGSELRLQRWMTDAAPVRANAKARETLTFGIGPRLHFKAGKRWIRPGVSWTHALDNPLKKQGYDMLALDVPIAF
jgi:hypothetical protein